MHTHEIFADGLVAQHCGRVAVALSVFRRSSNPVIEGIQCHTMHTSCSIKTFQEKVVLFQEKVVFRCNARRLGQAHLVWLTAFTSAISIQELPVAESFVRPRPLADGSRVSYQAWCFGCKDLFFCGDHFLQPKACQLLNSCDSMCLQRHVLGSGAVPRRISCSAQAAHNGASTPAIIKGTAVSSTGTLLDASMDFRTDTPRWLWLWPI